MNEAFSVESILFKDTFNNNTSNNISSTILKTKDEIIKENIQSDEDLKFFETYDMLNTYNTNQKIRMLKRLNNITNNIRNKNISNSCESYIRSLEEDTNTNKDTTEKKKNIFIRFFTWIKNIITRFFKMIMTSIKLFLNTISSGKWCKDWYKKAAFKREFIDKIFKPISDKFNLNGKFPIPRISSSVDFNSYAKVCRWFEQKVSVSANNSNIDKFLEDSKEYQKTLLTIDEKLLKFSNKEDPSLIDTFSLFSDNIKYLNKETMTIEQYLDAFKPEEIDKVSKFLSDTSKYISTSYASLDQSLSLILKLLEKHNINNENAKAFDELKKYTITFEKIHVCFDKGLIKFTNYITLMITVRTEVDNALK